MTATTMTGCEFKRDIARAKRRAKRAAELGPVFITERGKPTHVLLCMEDYRRLEGKNRRLADALSMAGLAEIDFIPAHLRLDSSGADIA